MDEAGTLRDGLCRSCPSQHQRRPPLAGRRFALPVMPPAAVDPAPPDRGEYGVRVPDREARHVEADRLARRPSVEDAQQALSDHIDVHGRRKVVARSRRSVIPRRLEGAERYGTPFWVALGEQIAESGALVRASTWRVSSRCTRRIAGGIGPVRSRSAERVLPDTRLSIVRRGCALAAGPRDRAIGHARGGV